jgi:cytochrome oxidase Cu insertion factor (SCO1/SenC/PrrC family)
MMLFPILRTFQVQQPSPLPRLGPIPAFELTDQNGAAFGTDNLLGRIWVASMVCSQCPTINPDLLEHLATIRAKTKNMVDAFRLVSFTVDPAVDTPEILSAFAKLNSYSLRWVFLTSLEVPAPVDVVLSNVYAHDRAHQRAWSAARPDEVDPRLGHMVALVDMDLCVRAYYDLRDDDAIDRLMRGINNVINQPGHGLPCSAATTTPPGPST